MPTTGGNAVFANSHAPSDATVIQRLREAGAIIFIKTNMDEMAQATVGLSTVGGQILNPYDLTKGPGGSSGGTGVAVAAGFATVGLGTETGVSVRSPASNNMLVGIVPSRGLVSRAGVIPISFTQDRIGPLAKTVADAAILLTHMRGFDADDLTTTENLARPVPNYTTWSPTGLRGKRVGVLRDMFRKGDVVQAGNALIEKQFDLMRAQGALVVDGLTTGIDLLGFMPTLRVNSYELQPAVDSYLRRRGAGEPGEDLCRALQQRQVAEGRHSRNALSRNDEGRQPRDQRRVPVAAGQSADGARSPDRGHGPGRRGCVAVSDEAAWRRRKPVPRMTARATTASAPWPACPRSSCRRAWTRKDCRWRSKCWAARSAKPTLLQLAHAYEQASRHRVPPKSTPPLPGEKIQF